MLIQEGQHVPLRLEHVGLAHAAAHGAVQPQRLLVARQRLVMLLPGGQHVPLRPEHVRLAHAGAHGPEQPQRLLIARQRLVMLILEGQHVPLRPEHVGLAQAVLEPAAREQTGVRPLVVRSIARAEREHVVAAGPEQVAQRGQRLGLGARLRPRQRALHLRIRGVHLREEGQVVEMPVGLRREVGAVQALGKPGIGARVRQAALVGFGGVRLQPGRGVRPDHLVHLIARLVRAVRGQRFQQRGIHQRAAQVARWPRIRLPDLGQRGRVEGQGLRPEGCQAPERALRGRVRQPVVAQGQDRGERRLRAGNAEVGAGRGQAQQRFAAAHVAAQDAHRAPRTLGAGQAAQLPPGHVQGQGQAAQRFGQRRRARGIGRHRAPRVGAGRGQHLHRRRRRQGPHDVGLGVQVVGHLRVARRQQDVHVRPAGSQERPGVLLFPDVVQHQQAALAGQDAAQVRDTLLHARQVIGRRGKRARHLGQPAEDIGLRPQRQPGPAGGKCADHRRVVGHLQRQRGLAHAAHPLQRQARRAGQRRGQLRDDVVPAEQAIGRRRRLGNALSPRARAEPRPPLSRPVPCQRGQQPGELAAALAIAEQQLDLLALGHPPGEVGADRGEVIGAQGGQFVVVVRVCEVGTDVGASGHRQLP